MLKELTFAFRLSPFAFLLTSSLLSAATYPPQYRWQTITTDHFYIHFHQGGEETAQRAAMLAENAHVRLTPMIGWEPDERTHLILADHVDLSNGSATPFPHNRIEVYVSAPGADPSSAIGYYDDWLNLVITHEYAHILHLDQARGFAGATRRVLGRNLLFGFPNEWSPLWLIEGLATLAESETTAAGRLKGTFVEMVLRTAAVEKRFATEAQASGFSPFWPTGNTRYYYGSKFLSWLAVTRGMDKLTQFINEYSSNIVPFRVNATAEEVYGTDMKSLWLQWSEEQQYLYRAERDRLAADGFTERTQLTKLGYETKNPVLSPDGKRLAYSHRGPYERATIRIRDIATGADVATHRINTPSPLSWSADGRSIAYSDLEFVGSFTLLSDLYVWDIDGGTRRITRGARLKDPAFTSDGRSLIAVENRAGRNRLVEVDMATGAVRAIVDPKDFRQFAEPAVSHDGSRIAVAEWLDGTINVVVYSRNGERLTNLTQSLARATNASPRFSRDDRTVWFSSDVTGVTNIFAVPTAGGAVRRLTNLYGGAFYPTSADGRRFFYSDYSSEGFDIAGFEATREYPIVARKIPATVVGNEAPASPGAVSPAEDGVQSEYSPWHSLRPRWWFPVISSATINDEVKAIIGLATSGGDVLGRHTYLATITNRGGSMVYSYDRFYPTLTLVAARYDEAFVSGYTDRTDRLLAQVAVPWRRLQWQLVGSAGVIRDRIDGDDRAGIFRGTLQGFRLGAFFNNAREYLFSISPESGVTALANYERLSGDASLQLLRGDVRGYLTIPYARSPFGRHVLAVRAAGGRNSGDFVLQRELKVGGEGFGELATLELTNFPVRGYHGGTLRGQSAAIGSVEYRFPIYEIERGPTTWPIFFNRVHGDVFADAGRVSGNGTIASTGAEVSADMIFGNVLPIRLRMGAAYLLREPGQGDVQPYFAIGSSF